MNELSELKGRMRALRNVKKVRLVNLPKLSVMILRFAFVDVKELEMENASLESHEVLSEVMRKKRIEEERRVNEKKRRREEGIVLNAEDLENLANDVTSISVKGCDDYEKETLDLSRFTKLKELKIASKCFNYVSQVRIVGLLELQTVSIGEAAFQNNAKDCKLQIQNCPSLLSMTIGNESFKSFSQLEMSGVKSLQSITMGCGCFRDANCVMRNMESLNRVTLGDLCFEKSLHTVIESGVQYEC